MKTTTLPATLAAGTFAVLGLAGCSAQTTADVATSAPAASAGPSAAANASFTDGDYAATGSYDSPGGRSAVAVSLTLQGGVVTAVKVVPKAENPTAQQYEAKFASGVGDLVVGKKLSDVNVTTVSGSSLTSQGFDAAITAIEGKARA